MNYLRKIPGLLLALVIGLNFEAIGGIPAFDKEPHKILFIGSSYFNYDDLPSLFKNLVENSGKEVYIDQQSRSGLYLSDHAERPSTVAKINELNWDYVILQGVGSNTAYPDTYTGHPVLPALITLRDKIRANCKSTKMVFCLPWAYEDGMTWLEGWTDTYSDMQLKIYDNTLKYSNEVGFMIAPVGWAWNTVLEEKSFPLHYLHRSDWNHPSLKGSYLMACVIFSTIYLESSVDNPFYGGLSEEEARYFQRIGSTTVLDDPELWNITTAIKENTKRNFPNRIHLRQNYPNPFNSMTTIEYSLSHAGVVKLIVFDMLGKTVRTISEKWKPSGNYRIEFDGSGLPTGIYYYSLTFMGSDTYRETNYTKARKFVLIN
ncbi:T9SS type A sorting domain-containing protein [candidate division KSB1 bacterium]|nr:T9SS type A sorting domain-containing protein [candidate division KSB1 bacterium]